MAIWRCDETGLVGKREKVSDSENPIRPEWMFSDLMGPSHLLGEFFDGTGKKPAPAEWAIGRHWLEAWQTIRSYGDRILGIGRPI